MKALFAGTFDPPTIGHVDIIRRAAALCDHLYVGIAENPHKEKGFFTLAQRKKMLNWALSDLDHIKVVEVEGLLVDFARLHRVDVLIRSLRPGVDFSHEYAMAAANRNMGGIETLFLPADPRYAHISSSLVREILAAGGNPEGFILQT